MKIFEMAANSLLSKQALSEDDDEEVRLAACCL